MTDNSTNVLLVEDNLPDARFVQEMLSTPAFKVIHSNLLSDARDKIVATNFDVVLLDLSLPDSEHLDTFQSMLEWIPNVPIIILTGLDDEEMAIRAVQLGAQDYIIKREISEYSLSRAIRYAIERKHTEENSKRLMILEQREEFMATLTHDLKNPLIGANRILEMMAQKDLGELSERQSNLLLHLRDNNKLLLSMIQNLIEVYKFEKNIDAVCLENTNLQKIMSSCLEDIVPIAQNRDINLKIDLPEQLREVLADATAIRRVLQNLLDNALKFTPSGGEISIIVHHTNGSVAIRIEDTGPGISEAEQKRLFQQFSQGEIGKKYTPGTGLGLYLCKQIVDAHHGQISCSSTEGAGTVFSVILPAA
ncbi:MAG: hybrid sensor histidine kinase/response regulator [Cyanobacteria bacterium]|nr:hybrid sensor histidine kinase/response regulator [Cyanobacteriota bacterium]